MAKHTLTCQTHTYKHTRPHALAHCLLQAFIECVDASDNGVNQWDSAEAPKYVNNTTLSARVARLNPR